MDRRNRSFLYAGTITAALVALAVALAAIAYLHQEARNRQASATRHLVKSVAQTVDGMVTSIDYVLQVSADEIGHQIATRRQLDGEALTRFLSRQQERFPHIDLLRATNGNVVLNSKVSLVN